MVRLRWPGSKVDGEPEKVDAGAGNYVQNFKNANFAHKEDTQMKKTEVTYVQLIKRRIVKLFTCFAASVQYS